MQEHSNPVGSIGTAGQVVPTLSFYLEQIQSISSWFSLFLLRMLTPAHQLFPLVDLEHEILLKSRFQGALLQKSDQVHLPPLRDHQIAAFLQESSWRPFL